MSDIDLLERWPGYTEQSWPERFAELDRRYAEFVGRSIDLTYRQAKIIADLQSKLAEAERALESNRSLHSLSQVQQRVPFSRSTIYAKVASGDFPAPIKISENRVAWDSRVIDAWIADKLQAPSVEALSQ